MFTIEARDHNGKWKVSRYAGPMTRERADSMAQDLEEHGNTVRVVPYVLKRGKK